MAPGIPEFIFVENSYILNITFFLENEKNFFKTQTNNRFLWNQLNVLNKGTPVLENSKGNTDTKPP